MSFNAYFKNEYLDLIICSCSSQIELTLVYPLPSICTNCKKIIKSIEMKTIKKVEIEPVFVTSIPDDLEENKLYISEMYKTATHLCLCGCGEKTITPLGGGKNWYLIKENNGSISLIGSVGNYGFPCKSHYIITKNVANFV